jgi:DNA polymerase-1
MDALMPRAHGCAGAATWVVPLRQGVFNSWRSWPFLVSDRRCVLIDENTGRVHTSYHQAVAATGRLSSSDPNLQNIPIRNEERRKIRQAFIAPKGYKLLAADYSQIELRIMAHLFEDKGLIAAFNAGEDIHRATAG